MHLKKIFSLLLSLIRKIIKSRIVRAIYVRLPVPAQTLLRWTKDSILLPLLRLPSKTRTYWTLLRSGLFYTTYYNSQYSEVAKQGIDPIMHYICGGAYQGCNPNPVFDSEYYLTAYPEVAASGISPLYHYIKYGTEQGKNPGPEFSTKDYLNSHPEIRESGINPLLHYLKHGVAEEN